jgi:bifunctional aspartokinase / homoserine dehydrogenase 1
LFRIPFISTAYRINKKENKPYTFVSFISFDLKRGKNRKMKILKFGGSSVAIPEYIRKVGAIVTEAARRERTIVVVSAFQGVTNLLIETARKAEEGDSSYKSVFDALHRRHTDTTQALLGSKMTGEITAQIERRFTDLSDVLHGIYLLRDCPPRSMDLVMSFGERLSAYIISSFIDTVYPSVYVDAREIVRTDDRFNYAKVLFEQTRKLTRLHINGLFKEHKNKVIPVVTGFIGTTEDGRTTTIGRNGSDYTAAVIGAALNVSAVEIWTDVDGVLSADPKAVPKAFVLQHISYEEAMELSYFGSKVLHPATIAPAISNEIPILIKNTLNPKAPGTLIARKTENWIGAAKGISSIDNVSLLTLRGMSMVGVPGTAERLFRALAMNNVNVILISQSSSEHTICFAIDTSAIAGARKAIAHEFRFEFQNRLSLLDHKEDQTIIAVVGQGMKGTPGVAGKIFQALGQNNINVSAIAQGASELNISLVVDSAQKVRALNVIHQAFFEKRKRLALIVIGVGNIGSALLRLLHQQQAYLMKQGFEVRVCAVANSKKYAFSPEGIDLSRWREILDGSETKMNVDSLLGNINGFEFTNVALLDCTASPEIVGAYPKFVCANMHVITPNKIANVLPLKKYTALLDLLADRQKYFFYEANIGAGLPIISTLKDLIASGDRVVKIEGIFSGTLSYLFNIYNGTQPFSEMVSEAHRLGYTEPDPREDLSGMDVARKLLILARQLGLQMELRDIKVESLVPAALRRGPFTDSFYASYARHDFRMHKRYESARKNNAVLRYVATLEGDKAYAGPQEIPLDHPFAAIKGSDNIIAFTTQWYSRTPLIVQGPGAGADVTAMGVFSDILKLLHYLPY